MKKNSLIDIVFYWLLLLAPFIYYIQYTAYGFQHIEVWVMFGLLIFIGLLLSNLEKCLGWIGRIILATLVITFSFSFLPGFKTTTMVLLVLVVSLALNLFLDPNIRKIINMMALVFIISILCLPISHQTQGAISQKFLVTQSLNQNLPPIIHIILDEQAGINGIPNNIADGKNLRAQLTQFYLENGFQLYTHAYSHYVETFNSVSNLLNFSSEPISHYYFNHNAYLKQNQYFKLLAQAGYQFRIYQFDSMINYCEPKQYPIQSCYQYPAANLNSILGLGIKPQAKFWFMLKSYLVWSQAYYMLQLSYQYYLLAALQAVHIHAPSWPWYQARTSSLWLPAVFQQLTQDIQNHPQGTVFFAHILAPHNPYVYNASCQLIKDPMAWQININADPTLNTPKERKMRYELYENQVRCVQAQINDLFLALKQAGIYQQSIIIINGDHGSRITELLPAYHLRNQFSQQDYRDCFDTLFAIKIPGEKAEINSEVLPINQLLAQVTANITGKNILVHNTVPFAYFLTPGYHAQLIPIATQKLTVAS